MGIACGAYAVAPYSAYIWKMRRKMYLSNMLFSQTRLVSLFTPDGIVCGAYAIRPYNRYNPKTRSILGLSAMDVP